MKKLPRYLIALFVIFTLNFIIPRAMPGDPITNLLGEDYVIDEASLAELKAELGLDHPLLIQYLRYWKEILQFDMGYSFRFHDRVTRVIGARLVWTLYLVGISILLGASLGTFLGSLAGWRHVSIPNKCMSLFFISINSMPPFFLSLVLLYVFAFRMEWFPLRNHMFLPVASMTLFLASRYYLIMRGSVLQEKGKHYVMFARAKGLYGRQILSLHIFKNASLPIVTLIALDFGFIFSGALFVEIVFSLNGMGTLIFDALLARDYPVLQGSFLIITIMVVASNWLVDMIYPLLDPRVKEKA